ncbi:MAG: DNA translocase FtsK 4TM domain-containing protein [Rickettsiales bacterium]|nr:DNA translocase FtsK 4TM domain-containing protein [Rickettsiales bacterium]
MKEYFLITLKILFGAILFLLGIISIFSVFSYNPFDPSWNFSSSAVIKNWAGVIGSNLSSLLITFLGSASYYFGLVMILWGIKIVYTNIKNNEAEEIWYNHPAIKFTFLLISLIGFAGFLGYFDKFFGMPSDYPTSSNGGFIGAMLAGKLEPLIGGLVYFIFFLFFFLTTALFTISISLKTWFKVAIISYLTISFAVKFLYQQISNFVRFTIDAFSGKLEEANKEYEIVDSAIENVSNKTPKKPKKITNIKEETAKLTDKIQHTLDMEMRDSFQLPPLSLLSLPEDQKTKRPSADSLQSNAEMLEKTLGDFGVQGKIIEVQPGPVVTLYSLEPSPGTKSSRIIGLADDIARSMSATSTRIAVIAGQNAIGIELPNSSRETVYFKELLLSNEFRKAKMALPICLGKDISGKAVVVDLAKTPHLLVAGTTGSGKSVGLNGMILSLLYKFSPQECKFIMIDPKMLELSVYQDIPHLLSPVVTEPQKAIVALKWTVKEMENRYRLMSQLNVRNIDGYNEKILEAKKAGKILTRNVQTGYDIDSGSPITEEVPLEMEKLPYIVVVVDEMADLMLVAGKEIEASVQRLAQMARAAGIHVILATQRPSVDVITGIIKANFPSRISYQVTSKIDSRTILGEQGAEQLLGRGDLLFMGVGTRITRVHGPFVSDEEVHQVSEYLRSQGKPNYVQDVTTAEEDMFTEDSENSDGNGKDSLYSQAVAVILRDKKVSTSYLQRVFKIGYNKAANLIDQMEREGIITPADHTGKRRIVE